MKSHFWGFGALLCLAAVGCSSADSASSAMSETGPGAPGGGGSGSGGDASSGSASGSKGGGGQIQAGTLTAGVWDDNRNFDFFLGYRAEQAKQKPPGMLSFTEDDHRAANAAFSQPQGAKAKLDVSLVIDTTGSMGDEISYLQKEFDALTVGIQSQFPNAEQRWSLVVYRDQGDEYVVRTVDFTADLSAYRDKLREQGAGGGGDFPEAPDQGLEAATQLSWRSGPDTAKLAFWIADAPHHAQNEPRLSGAIRASRSGGIHVYPVASSGVDEFTELTMRSTAQLTGGRYVFLTNDSGVGGDHKEPTVPCYFVTKLDKAISRMVAIEMTGEYREPEPGDVIRTGGDPKNGVCSLQDRTVQIF